jgi:hypothetical protein
VFVWPDFRGQTEERARHAPQARTRPLLAVVRARTAKQAPFLPSLPHRLVAQHALQTQVRVRRVQPVIATPATQDQMEVYVPVARRANTNPVRAPEHAPVALRTPNLQQRAQHPLLVPVWPALRGQTEERARDAHQERTRPLLAVVRARTAKQAPIQPRLQHRLEVRAHHALQTRVRLLEVYLVIARLDTLVLGVIVPPARQASTNPVRALEHA